MSNNITVEEVKESMFNDYIIYSNYGNDWEEYKYMLTLYRSKKRFYHKYKRLETTICFNDLEEIMPLLYVMERRKEILKWEQGVNAIKRRDKRIAKQGWKKEKRDSRKRRRNRKRQERKTYGGRWI